MPTAIEAQGLAKNYGALAALKGIDFAVKTGEVFAFLGPNGAGKTTTINIFCGLLRPDAGRAAVCGLEVARDPVAVKQRIGVVPDESNLYPELTCRRNLEYLGELYGLPRAARKSRAAELIAAFDLADKAVAPFRALSRGLKRRLTVAAALIHKPEVVFLDEPTIGLDVPSARALRALIRRINQDGTTVFLTTHNLAEAEELSHCLAIIIKGQIVAQGTAAEIRKRVEKAKVLEVRLSGPVDGQDLRQACPAVLQARPTEDGWRLEVADFDQAVRELMDFSRQAGLTVLDLTSLRPSLEDAFMSLVAGPEAERRAA